MMVWIGRGHIFKLLFELLSGGSMGIEGIIKEIMAVLDEKDVLREEALRLTREVIRLSGDAVKAVHRGDFESARKQLDEAREIVKKLREKLARHPDLYYTGYVQSAHQEYVEATLLLHYVLGEPFLGPKELGVPEADYALGIGDFIGELRRYFLRLLIDGDVEAAERVYGDMEGVYNALMKLGYPKGLVNVRVKQDQARHIVERTLEDLTRAKLSKALEEKLQKVLEAALEGDPEDEGE